MRRRGLQLDRDTAFALIAMAERFIRGIEARICVRLYWI
jgi:hypothetical protein